MQTARLALGCAVSALVLVAFTGATPVQGGQSEQDAKSAPRATAFAFTIPGTTVVLDMVPVTIPGAADAKDAPSTKTLYVAKTEATWDLYDAFVLAHDKAPETRRVAVDAVARPTKAYVLADRGFGHTGFPALSISSKGAEACCAWLTALSGVTFRLPTEAEWEVAARAGDAEPAPKQLDDVAWHLGNDDRKTRAVATKTANAFGLHDTLGNVAEWCSTQDGKFVLRGGCFLDQSADVNYAARRVPAKAWNQSDPQIPKSKWWLADAAFAGFRVVCEGVPSP